MFAVLQRDPGFSEYNDLEVKIFCPECEVNLVLGHLPRLNIIGHTFEPKTFFRSELSLNCTSAASIQFGVWPVEVSKLSLVITYK